MNYIKKATEKQREAEIMAKRESEDESHYRYANIAREQDREWQTINGAKDDGSETLVPYADLPPEDQEIWD